MVLRLRNLLIRTLTPTALCALAVVACGSQQKPSVTTSTRSGKAPAHATRTAVLYSSLPLHGPQRTQSLEIQRGIDLALDLAHHKVVPIEHGVAPFKVEYKSLSDTVKPAGRHSADSASVGAIVGTITTSTTSTTSTSTRNASKTVQNAEVAARNPQTVAYIGELSSSATELSLPILNQAGILQITPGSGYPGLISSYSKDKITASGEPNRYYPQSTRTLLRLISSDIVQASAALDVLHADGCQRFSAWRFDDSPEATALFNAVVATASKYGMVYKPAPALSDKTDFVNYADLLKPDDLHCAVMVGHVTHAALELTTELREQLGLALTIVGTHGFCNGGWARGIAQVGPKLGLSKAAVANVVAGLYCTTPELPLVSKYYPGAKQFARLFRAHYHGQTPTTYDYYGYEAVKMVIRGLEEVGSGEDTRQQVLDSLVEDIAAAEAGAYSFENSGDRYSTSYGIEHFPGGILEYYRVVTPTAHLLSSDG